MHRLREGIRNFYRLLIREKIDLMDASLFVNTDLHYLAI